MDWALFANLLITAVTKAPEIYQEVSKIIDLIHPNLGGTPRAAPGGGPSAEDVARMRAAVAEARAKAAPPPAA